MSSSSKQKGKRSRPNKPRKIHQKHDNVDAKSVRRSKFQYFNPNQFASWCCNVVLAELDEMWLIEHKSDIHSVFVEFDIDSFRVHQIRGSLLKQVTQCLIDRTGAENEAIANLTEKLFDELCSRMPMAWNHVIEAASHRMSETISHEMESLRYDETPLLFGSGDVSDLQFEAKSEAKERLTAAEIDILQSVITEMFHSRKKTSLFLETSLVKNSFLANVGLTFLS